MSGPGRPPVPRAAGPAESAAPTHVRVEAPPRELELAIARLLNLGALASVLLLAIGVVLAAAAGFAPIEGSLPPFDPARIVSDLLALKPEGFLWLGLVFVIATPASRVVASLIGFASAREWLMALISAAVLLVIAAGVALSSIEGG